MSARHKTTIRTSTSDAALPHSLVLLLAVGAGFGVASLYYAQPILGLLATAMQASDSAIASIPTVTQLGYALGILFLSPLGDKYDRRPIILAKAAILTLALALCGLANGIGFLLVASLLIGISATLAQDIVPAAAHLAPASSRGKVVGTVMMGLLLGILLSRVASGLVAARYGWRLVYGAAAVAVALFALLAWKRLPRFEATTQLSYRSLLISMAHLWRQHSALRQIVFGIAPEARSRANALLFTFMFVGMAAGSTLGGVTLTRWGWMGVTVFATAASASALLVRLIWRKRSKSPASLIRTQDALLSISTKSGFSLSGLPAYTKRDSSANS